MHVVKVPGINALGKTKGCENSGEDILKEMRNIFTNESGRIVDVDMLDLEEIHVDNMNLELTNRLIYENAIKCFETKPKIVFLGGDHSVSYPLIRAFKDYCKNSEKEPCLIVFDAHPDCMPPTDEFPTHGEWLRKLIESGFPKENVLLVGLRNSEIRERTFLREKNIRTISIDQITEDLHETTDAIMEFSNNKELYVSIDIDFIDPAFAPATGYKEPAGLSSRDFIYILKRLNKIKNFKAADIVEINSEEDKKFGNITTKLGAKILSELM